MLQPAIEIDTDDSFPRDLPATVNLEQLRERRDREAARSVGRAERKKRAQYVLPLRIFCYLIFSSLLLEKLDGNISTWLVVFIPLWLENFDKIWNNIQNIREALLEGRVDRETRFDILLPPIAKICLDIGSVVTKFFLAARIDLDPAPLSYDDDGSISSSTLLSNSPSSSSSSSFQLGTAPSSSVSLTVELATYRQVFLPFWICAAIGTFIICWTPDRPEVRHADDTKCQKFWRQITTGCIYGGSAILMPLMVVNKVDGVSQNSTWTTVFVPVWGVLLLAGVIGFLVLPIYSLCVVCDALHVDSTNTRSERMSIARLLMAFAYSTSSTAVALCVFLLNLSVRLNFDAFMLHQGQTSASSHGNTTGLWNSSSTPSSSSSSSSPSSSNVNVTNSELCWPLILGFLNLLFCCIFVRFVMIRQRIAQRQLARQQFEAAAFDTQQGGVQYGSESRAFEPIEHPVVLVGDETRLMFQLWSAISDIGAEMTAELDGTVGLFNNSVVEQDMEETKETQTFSDVESRGVKEQREPSKQHDAVSAPEHVSDTSATVNINKEEKKAEEKSESETLGEEHTTVDVMSMSKEAKEEEAKEEETKEEEAKEEEAKEEETKDDSSCYFFEEGTENTCFICADLPPGK